MKNAAPPVSPDGIIDTSVVIALASQDPSTLPIFPAISAITLVELSVGPLVASDAKEQADRQLHLQLVEASFDPLPLDAAAARSFGQVAAALRSQGRKPAARAFDALIAATALAHGLPLYTLNPDDFTGIAGLEVRVPREVAGEPPSD